ncbi:MAG: lonely Cys domain-containing protein, partial [Streptomyces sp.]|nr:lonely Cys domain-containing protein [Streptomyces sp.]
APDKAAAERLLEALHGRDLRFRSGRFNLDVVARHVLRLPKDARVDQSVRTKLFGLVRDAEAEGRAGSLAALGAFHVEKLAAIGSDRGGHFTVAEDRVPGLNLLVPDAVELDSDRTEVLTQRPDGSLTPVGGPRRQTPWPKEKRPYVVGASWRDGRAVVRLPDRSTLEVDVEEFVELVAARVARAELPPGTPIVLAVPFAGRYSALLQELADRTGQVVWPHSGEVMVNVRTDGTVGIDTVAGRPGVPVGTWFPLRPGQGPVLDESVPGWYRDVLLWPVVSEATGEQVGYSSFAPAEYAEKFEELDRRSDRMTTYVDLHVALQTVSPERELPRPGPAGSPFPEADAVRISAHGGPDYLMVAVRSGDSVVNRFLHGDEAVAFVTWLVSRQPKHRWIDLPICWIGSPGDSDGPRSTLPSSYDPAVFVADPLRELSVSRRVARSARRWMRAPYGPEGETKLEPNGKYARALFTDPRGRPREWVLERPDPEGVELDRYAVMAGLHSGPGPVPAAVRAAVRERTLIAVLALKSMFGVHVEDRPDFGGLLRGVVAVEEMWLADPEFRRVGPLTLDLVRRVIAAHAGPGAEVDQDVARDALVAAAEWWAARPRGPRGERVDTPWDFVRLPVVRLGAQWVQGDQARSEAATVLNLPEPRALSEAERLRMLWAWTKTMDLLTAPGVDVNALTRRVLHPDPDSGVEEPERGEARAMLTRAFAVGRDASDPDVAAAYALEANRAFAVTGSDTVMDGVRGSGRDFTGESWPRVNLAKIRTPGGLVDAAWRSQDLDRKAAGPVPYLVRIEMDELDPDVVVLMIADEEFRIPVAEFLELMANDPVLTAKARGTRVLLSHTRPAPGIEAVAWLLSQGLGRPVGWTDDLTNLSGKDDQGNPVLTALSGADTGPAWYEAEPETPLSPIGPAARPAPRPYPLPGSGPAGPAVLTTAPSTTAPVAPHAKMPPSLHGGPEAPEGSASAERSALPEAPPASAWDMARIRYAEEALAYEERLAAYLAADERVNVEFARVAEAFWALVLHNGMDYRKFGSELPSENGAVGTSFESLQRVVESGNLRERADFLFAGSANGLIPDLMGGRVPRHPVIRGERDDRRKTEAYKRYKQKEADLVAAGVDEEAIAEEVEDLVAVVRTPLRPEDVQPPLSQDERRIAVRDSDGTLLWRPAGLSDELPMSAGLQERSQESGGLVLTGTSGSTHYILTLVARLSDLTGFPVDLGLIRAGLVSTMAYVGDHTFHEVMAGAQLVLDEVAHPGVPDYVDGWYRYRNVYPLTEEELRAHVARDGLFPDEHALELFAELDDGAEEGSESDEGDDGSER